MIMSFARELWECMPSDNNHNSLTGGKEKKLLGRKKGALTLDKWIHISAAKMYTLQVGPLGGKYRVKGFLCWYKCLAVPFLCVFINLGKEEMH